MYRTVIPLHYKPELVYEIHRDVVRFLGGSDTRYLFRVEQDVVIVQSTQERDGFSTINLPQSGATAEFFVRCNAVERIARSSKVRYIRDMPEIELYFRRIFPQEAGELLCIDRAVAQAAVGKGALLHTVDIHGVIRVNNPHNLSDIVCSGLGRAKSMGCGMMIFSDYEHHLNYGSNEEK